MYIYITLLLSVWLGAEITRYPNSQHIVNMQYFTICDKKNPRYRIDKLVCHCFQQISGFNLSSQEYKNCHIKNVSLILYKRFIQI